eukprot:2092154-Pyramimonas_sp.AAC.1
MPWPPWLGSPEALFSVSCFIRWDCVSPFLFSALFGATLSYVSQASVFDIDMPKPHWLGTFLSRCLSRPGSAVSSHCALVRT